MASRIATWRLGFPPADFYRNCTIVCAVVFAALLLAYVVASWPGFRLPTREVLGGTAFGKDFLNTWMGGRSALGQGPAAWYDFTTYNLYLRALTGTPDLHGYVWSYPPHILLFTWPLGLLPYLPALIVWTLAGLALFVLVARSGGVETRHLAFIALAPAVFLNAFFGQNGCFTAALLIGGLTCLDRRPILAGVLFGILTVKPQLGLLLPVMLVLTGRWRTILSAAVTTAALVAATAALYGREVWTGYFELVVPMQQHLQEHGQGLLFLIVSSVFYGARLVGLPLGLAWGLQAVVSGLVLAAVVWTFWRRRDAMLSMAFLIVATFLFTPYALNYDMVVFGWVIALLLQRADNQPLDHYLLFALWVLPVAMMLGGLIKVPLAVLVLPAVAARLLWRLVREERAAASQDARTLAPVACSGASWR